MAKQAARRPRAQQALGAGARGVRGAGVTKPHQAAAASSAAIQANSTCNPSRTPTAFEGRLYALCKCIPAGRVATYGVLAEVLGSAPRACGQALRRNPFAPVVPCHRVIAASLELGGFSGQWGVGCPNVDKKRRLLAEEGVKFGEGGKLLPSAAACVMTPAELRAAAAAAGALIPH